MCGILGLFAAEGVDAHDAAFARALSVASYRGPDGTGTRFFSSRGASSSTRPQDDSDAALGHLRLAIIDLTDTGAQPMCNETADVWITFNGEIYNYIELRDELKSLGHTFRSNSDTETIIHAYEQWGDACVTRFNGMWAFALLDLRRRRIFCSRDRFGVKPLHYYHDGAHFAFASEIKQLLEFKFVRRRANERAILEYLAYTAVDYCEETFFDRIFKLPQGHNLIFDFPSRQITVQPYYEPTLTLGREPSYGEAAREYRELLTDAVRLRLRSDVEVGTCLSGGVDSSSIVCLIRQMLAADGKSHVQRTFSSHFDDPEANEIEYMQHVIDQTGVQARIIRPQVEDVMADLERVVWHQEEPFASTSIFAQWFVYKEVHANGVKVMLDGQGVDEQLGGYTGCIPLYFDELRLKGMDRRLGWEQYRHDYLTHKRSLLGVAIANGKASAASPPLPPYSEWLKIDPNSLAERSRYLPVMRRKQFGEQEPFNNILYLFTFLTNLQQLFHYQDRNSMAHSVEARVPFMDYRLVEYAFQLPSRYKFRNGYTKRLLRDSMEGILPKKIQWRVNKLGFATPERRWQQSVLKPYIADALEGTLLSPYLEKKSARRYVDLVHEHNLIDWTPWRFLSVHLWMKSYGL